MAKRDVWDRLCNPYIEAAPVEVQLPPAPLTPTAEMTLQQHIDELCIHFASAFGGIQVTGDFLGRVQRVISTRVGQPVVGTFLPGVKGMVGYALSRSNLSRAFCHTCEGVGLVRGSLDSQWNPMFAGHQTFISMKPCQTCNGTGNETTDE